MNGRSLVVCTIVGTLVLFVWQVLSNTVIPWHAATYHPFAVDTTAAVVRAFRVQAPTNGVYTNPHGMVVMMSATPDYVDQTTLMGKMLGRQAAIDLFVAAILCLLAARVREQQPIAVAAVAAFGGLAASVMGELGNWNWYGFGIPWALVNVADATIAFFIAGYVIAWLARRMNGVPVSVPAGSGYAAAHDTVKTG
ncbi:MAG TPA: hypothetical protein VHB25_10345 [Gemmatimonadaceae bacterium]|nr:hypothetical protein [Gemmatimonadaceae bacterium]